MAFVIRKVGLFEEVARAVITITACPLLPAIIGTGFYSRIIVLISSHFSTSNERGGAIRGDFIIGKGYDGCFCDPVVPEVGGSGPLG